MVYAMNERFGLPQVVVSNIDNLAKNVMDNRIDALLIFIGGERMGKSTLMSRVAFCFASFLKTKVVLKKDYFYDQTEFINACLKATFADNDGKPYPKKGGEHCIKIFDEPVLGMNARKWASEGNILINQMFSIIGFKYMVVLVGFPSWWMVDNTAREHRVAALFQVYGKVDKNGFVKKGYFKMFTGSQARNIYRNQETRRTVFPKTKFTDLRFESMEGTEFWKDYEEFSPIAKQSATEKLLIDLQALKEGKFKGKRTKNIEYIEEG